MYFTILIYAFLWQQISNCWLVHMTPLNLLRLPTEMPSTKLTLGCRILDRLLGGGIPTETITEIVGEAGIGKTQLALQLLLTAQLPIRRGGLGGASLYLHSDFSFPFRRLNQLASSTRYGTTINLDKIFIHSVPTVDHMFDVLSRLDVCVRNLNIKLIIVDSIASMFRGVYENCRSGLIRRSSILFKMASKLKLIGRKYGVAVVVTNQVTDLFDSGINNRIGNATIMETSGRHVCASLGLSWASCVNTRLFMSRSADIENAEGSQIIQKSLRVILAAHLPDCSSNFEITVDGVIGKD